MNKLDPDFEAFSSLEKMVKNITYEVSAKYNVFNRTTLMFNDLEQVGLLSAWKCVAKFNGGRTTLKTYAYKRVRGSMLDELRKTGVLSRQELVREAKFTDIETCFHENLSVDHNTISEIDLKRAIAGETGRNKFVLDKYLEGYDIKEIGDMLGLTRSRASQILKVIRMRLANRLNRPT